MSTKRKETARRITAIDGTILCSCGCGEIPKPPRRTWYSDQCVERWKCINDPAHIRLRVFERDRGICAACGCDAAKEFAKFREAKGEISRLVDKLYWGSRNNMDWEKGRWVFRRKIEVPLDYKNEWLERERMKKALAPVGMRNWTAGRSTGWDADHIVPVVEGGGGCGLDNYRTLCHPCHKEATAHLAKRRALARNPKNRCKS